MELKFRNKPGFRHYREPPGYQPGVADLRNPNREVYRRPPDRVTPPKPPQVLYPPGSGRNPKGYSLPGYRGPAPGKGVQPFPNNWSSGDEESFGQKSARARKAMGLARAAKGIVGLGNPIGDFATGVGFELLDYANPSRQGPSGYEMPVPVISHWGPYDCGATPYIQSKLGGGCLTPESAWACLGGQVATGNPYTAAKYGDPLVARATHNKWKSLTLGRWNGSTVAGRITLIEHWCFASPGISMKPGDVIPYRRAPILPAPLATPPRPSMRDRGFGKPEPSPYPDAPPAKPPAYKPPYVIDGHPHIPNEPGKPKYKISAGALGDLYGALTEASDALRAFEKNVDRKKYGTIPKGLHNRALKMAAYIAGGGKVDWPGVAKDLAMDKVQDAIIGKLNKAAAKAITGTGYWRRPVGPGAGGNFNRRPVRMKGI